MSEGQNGNQTGSSSNRPAGGQKGTSGRGKVTSMRPTSAPTPSQNGANGSGAAAKKTEPFRTSGPASSSDAKPNGLSTKGASASPSSSAGSGPARPSGSTSASPAKKATPASPASKNVAARGSGSSAAGSSAAAASGSAAKKPATAGSSSSPSASSSGAAKGSAGGSDTSYGWSRNSSTGQRIEAESASTTTRTMSALRDESDVATGDDTRPARQAHLRLMHIEPWSVTRMAFLVSVALMIVAVVAAAIFWIVMDLTGMWDQINGSVTNVLSDNSGAFDVTNYLGFGRLVGLTLVLSAVNVVLMTAFMTVAAHLYNLASELLGGIEVTFSDR